jgi:hypothetical protein
LRLQPAELAAVLLPRPLRRAALRALPAPFSRKLSDGR